MATQILSKAQPGGSSSSLRYFSPRHHAEALRIALHTKALNDLAVSRWHLQSDTGSTSQALIRARQAVQTLERLLAGGAA